MTRMRARAWASVVAVIAVVPATARAMDAEVTSDTAAQFYDVRSPTGGVILTRRRLTTTLGVGAYDLLDAPQGDVKSPELSFRARLPYDAAYGAAVSETAPTPGNQDPVPGFQP